MAKYDISLEGLESLRNLYGKLSGAIEEIERSSVILVEHLEAMEGLGIYHKEILLLVGHVIRMLKQVREGENGIDILLGSLKQLASEIESILCMSLLNELNEDMEGDEEPRQVQKTLRKR